MTLNENAANEGKLRRELGLSTVVFFIFGYVVGAGILIQTGVTAGITGPSLWLAFLIAGIPNILSAIIVAYIVSAFPVSGGSWVYSSRLGSPLIGFIVVASVILHIIGALALLAAGFGNYFELFIPGSLLPIAIIIMIIFYIVNLFGIKFAGWVQILMAICGDFLVIFIFIIFGLPHVDAAKLTGAGSGGMFPTGFVGIFMGAVILSFSYAGFTSVIEIGGEIKNPRRNIPLGILLSFFLIAIVYTLVAVVMTGNMDWRTLGAMEGTLTDVAALFFPIEFVIILNILVLIAIASTIHGILIAFSRDLFSAARDRIVPSVLSKINKKYGTPHWSLTFFVIATIVLLFFQTSIIDLSVLCNFAVSIPGLILAYIPIKLEKRFPDLLKKSRFLLNRKVIVGIIIFNIIYNLFAIIAMIVLSPRVVVGALIFYAIAMLYYVLRKKWLEKNGIDIEEICKTIPEETLEV
ncbi:MAG: APC family permease [Promethearchaeota archaeon]